VPFLANDGWLEEHSPVEPALLHAIGYIVYRWNDCELYARALYCLFKFGGIGDGWGKAEKIQRRDVAEYLIGVCDKYSPKMSYAFDPMREAIKDYEINGENRNRYNHFIRNRSKNGSIQLLNPRSLNFIEIFRRKPIPSDIASVRLAAEYIDANANHLSKILNYFSGWPQEIIVNPTPAPTRTLAPTPIWTP
jgi:hypothetical protein